MESNFIAVSGKKKTKVRNKRAMSAVKMEHSKRKKLAWSMLLKKYGRLNVRTDNNVCLPYGHSPRDRPISEYIRYGFINLDKPCSPSSHELVSWIQSLLNVQHARHSGILDPMMSGCLIICLGRATKLIQCQQRASKEYVVMFQLHESINNLMELTNGLEALKGMIYQRTPLMLTGSSEILVKKMFDNKLLKFDQERNSGVFWVSCEAGTYMRTMWLHLGLVIGVGGNMVEVKRIRSGNQSVNKGMVTINDLIRAQRKFGNQKCETLLRGVIQLLEYLLKQKSAETNKTNMQCHDIQAGTRNVTGFQNNEPRFVVTKGKKKRNNRKHRSKAKERMLESINPIYGESSKNYNNYY